jgi:hypothetical protein
MLAMRIPGEIGFFKTQAGPKQLGSVRGQCIFLIRLIRSAAIDQDSLARRIDIRIRLIQAAGSFHIGQCFIDAALRQQCLHAELAVMPEWKSLKRQHLKQFPMAARR